MSERFVPVKTLWQQIHGESLSVEAVLEAVLEAVEEIRENKVEGDGVVILLFIDGHGQRYRMVRPA